MNFLLRAVRLVSVTVWVGGLIFFAFVVAPVAFSVLPSTHEAGLVVGHSLTVLNLIGYACGLLAMLGVAGLWLKAEARGRTLLLMEGLLIVAMLAATAVVQNGIVPRMERDRLATGGDVDAAPADNPARQDFERLHPISEKVEGAALLLGIVVVLLIAAEGGSRRSAQA